MGQFGIEVRKIQLPEGDIAQEAAQLLISESCTALLLRTNRNVYDYRARPYSFMVSTFIELESCTSFLTTPENTCPTKFSSSVGVSSFGVDTAESLDYNLA